MIFGYKNHIILSEIRENIREANKAIQCLTEKLNCHMVESERRENDLNKRFFPKYLGVICLTTILGLAAVIIQSAFKLI